MTPPPEDAKLRIIHEWRRKADDDLAVAERLLADDADSFSNAITFHCQQAAEKYLKSLLTCWDIEFPKTHMLARLIALVEQRDAALASSLMDAVGLTPYGVELRYPGDRPDASADDAREAIRLTQQICNAIVPLLSRASGDDKS
ncbi:MAG: HEPN domain-containing protein [Phycisphaeraceae bacterium]|nr:HEPN domain-containing protein [Phycisphaeraceae bacterium]